MFMVGEKVAYLINLHEAQPAIILAKYENSSTFLIRILDETKKEIVVYSSQLKKIPQNAFVDYSNFDCTCGVKFIRDGGKHSDWCDTTLRLKRRSS